MVSDNSDFDNQCWILMQGDNVPAPFMSFEAVGFPPDMLREVLLASLLIDIVLARFVKILHDKSGLLRRC